MRISRSRKKQLLEFACLSVALTGVGYVAAAFPSTDFVPRFIMDVVFWPLDGAQSFAAPDNRIMTCTVGATMILLSYIIFKMLNSFPSTFQPTVERIILTGLIGWFIIEAAFSLIIGVPWNLALNALFAGIFVVPIVLPSAVED